MGSRVQTNTSMNDSFTLNIELVLAPGYEIDWTFGYKTASDFNDPKTSFLCLRNEE